MGCFGGVVDGVDVVMEDDGGGVVARREGRFGQSGNGLVFPLEA